MFSNKRKSLINKTLFNQVTLAILGLMILTAISYPLAKNISKQKELNKEIEELEQEITDLESKNLELTGLIEYIESDQFVQEQARLNLNYKKEGEKVVVIKDKVEEINNKEKVDNSNNKTIYNIRGLGKIEAEKEINNPVRWWRYFLNK